MGSVNESVHQLRCFVERLERLDDEIKGMRDDRRDVLAEAKAFGFDTKTVNAVVRRRRIEPHARDEADALLETYEIALGMARPATIDGGELGGMLALPAPPAKLTNKNKAMAEALAWASGSVG